MVAAFEVKPKEGWFNMGLKLGDISPLAGIMTGEGAIGKLADKGLLGLGPRMIASRAQEKDEARDLAMLQAQQAQKAEAAKKQEMAAKMRRQRPQQSSGSTGGMSGYKSYAKGGSVSSASKRADGCATKGKTKGRMV
jgi:hypothetical protein